MTAPLLPDLRGQAVLVTGAGSGFGRACAIALAAAGVTVALLGRKVKPLEATYDAILAAGGAEPGIVPFDLATLDDAAGERIANALETQLGRLDGVVHSAAQFRSLTPLSQQDAATWKTLTQVDLVAPALLTRACMPLLDAAPVATVVFVADTHGARPAAFWGAYGVAKAGLIALAQTLDEEWAYRGTHRAHAAVPGPMRSPIRQKSHSASDALSADLPSPEALAPALVQLFARSGNQSVPSLVHLQPGPPTV